MPSCAMSGPVVEDGDVGLWGQAIQSGGRWDGDGRTGNFKLRLKTKEGQVTTTGSYCIIELLDWVRRESGGDYVIG